MAYTAWSVVYGEQPTAAKWNQLGTNDAGFKDGTNIDALAITNAKLATGIDAAKLSNPYKFSAYRNAALNSSATPTKIAFDTELFDTGNNFDAVTNRRFTAPVAGFYQFTAQVAVTQSGNLYALMYFYVNGVGVVTTEISSTNVPMYLTASPLLQLAAGDYVEIYFQTQNVVAIQVGKVNTYFSGFLVSTT